MSNVKYFWHARASKNLSMQGQEYLDRLFLLKFSNALVQDVDRRDGCSLRVREKKTIVWGQGSFS